MVPLTPIRSCGGLCIDIFLKLFKGVSLWGHHHWDLLVLEWGLEDYDPDAKISRPDSDIANIWMPTTGVGVRKQAPGLAASDSIGRDVSEFVV